MNKQNLKSIQATELANFPHGFYTRLGGVSKGDLASLNCGYGADEPRVNIDHNRALVADSLGAAQAIQTVYQCHSDQVVHITQPISGEPPRADAVVTATPGLPIGVLTADCAPILLADSQAGVIGAAHAGWRGALGGVIENTIAAMNDLGANDIQAVVGPCISQNNYQVGTEFMDEFTSESPDFARYFSGDGSIYFNLPGFVCDRLRMAGAQARWIGECTYADPPQYFSYRRATHKGETEYGRLISAVMIHAQ